MKHRIRKFNLAASSTRKRRSHSIGRMARLLGCFLLTGSIMLAGSVSLVQAQTGAESPPAIESPAAESPRPTPSQTFALPRSATIPTVAPAEPGQYVLEFNRSPVVGNRLRLQSIYDEARLQFTRPRDWQAESVKVLLRFRHSAALYASRSNLTVLVNGTSVGSVPLNKPQGEIGSVAFDVPTNLLQDYNEVVIAALQNNSPTCTQDPYDPSLWTEILPDSKVVFDYEPQAIALDFSRYPFPVYDTLSLQGNRVAYLLPQTIDDTWLTTTTRYQTSLGRIAEYRSLDTRLIASLNEVEEQERLIVIGTPEEQPALAALTLPLAIQGGNVLDGQQRTLPPDVGVLMLTTTAENQVPVLVATGNSSEGVAKAVQFLAQSQDQKIGTGSVIFVNQVTEIPTPSSREWAGYLPTTDSFRLSDLRTYGNQPYGDVMVRGSHAPALEFDFRALPDDQFSPGNTMVLRYSYSPQVNPVTSLVEVELDGIPVNGRRLSSVNGATRQEFRLDLPERIRPDSKMQVNFRLDPRERRACSRVTDQQLWGTIHADTSFDLNRQNVVNIPDLDLFRFGYPFAAPQDLSSTAIVLPDNPTEADLLLLLETSERLGRLSKAESVKLNVYRTSQLPSEVRSTAHLIGIGEQERFPFPEAFQDEGFNLNTVSLRQWQQSQIQSSPDAEGVVKQVVSPWNGERVLLALSSQSPEGLGHVRDLIAQDPLFYQLQGDTVLISANTADPSPFDANDYTLQFLRLSPPQQVVGDQRSWWLLFRSNWLILVPALVIAALLLYGVAQLYLQRVSPASRS
ncbi:cellulose biosynthesis cyclic di-GMP-binding regulatory protein BcsB [Egbenema bharatensis]|uniref:cellulose biosynthesis cyclic di-GMP-binding regulatory protein BcsB n=1 Tax=Egbenema bharatensis TaxID=3463334 RepID=UPI003A86A729